MKRTLLKLTISAYMAAIIAVLLLIAAEQCHAQFYPVAPDCCLQAADLTRQNAALQTRLTTALTVLDSTRAVDARIIAATDERVRDLEEVANTRIGTLQAQVADLTASQIDYDRLKDERDRLRGKTWAGRLLRKVRDGAAVVGTVTVTVLVVKAVIL